MSTPTNLRAEILSDLWLNYRTDEEFQDFMQYNDLGLPLAYAYANNLVKLNPPAETMINETFDLLLAGLDVQDTEEGFETLDDIFGIDFGA